MLKVILLVLVIVPTYGFNFPTDHSNREKRPEFFMGFNRLGNFSLESKYDDGTLDANSSVGLVFEGGYNYNRFLFFGAEFLLNKNNYKADVTLDNGDKDTYLSSLEFATLAFVTRYSILPYAFTPYLELGLGFTAIDSGVPSGETIGRCWWDVYHGVYVCDETELNHRKTVFSYSLGMGVRYEITKTLVFKSALVYRKLDYTSTASRPEFDNVSFSIGYITP